MEWNQDSKMEDLEGITPAEAAQIFATEYDEILHSLRTLLGEIGMPPSEFEDLLGYAKMLMEATVDVPDGLTVAQMRPYLLVSDVLTLGLLTKKLWDRRQDVITFGKMMGFQ